VILWLRLWFGLWLGLRWHRLLVEGVKEVVIVMVLVEVIEQGLLVQRRRVVDWSRRPVCGRRVVVLRLRLWLGFWLWLRWHGLLVEVVKEVVVVMVLV
jgi:hypothetical protein